MKSSRIFSSRECPSYQSLPNLYTLIQPQNPVPNTTTTTFSVTDTIHDLSPFRPSGLNLRSQFLPVKQRPAPIQPSHQPMQQPRDGEIAVVEDDDGPGDPDVEHDEEEVDDADAHGEDDDVHPLNVEVVAQDGQSAGHELFRVQVGHAGERGDGELGHVQADLLGGVPSCLPVVAEGVEVELAPGEDAVFDGIAAGEADGRGGDQGDAVRDVVVACGGVVDGADGDGTFEDGGRGVAPIVA